MKTLDDIRHNSACRLMLGTVQFGLDYGIANTAGRPDEQTVQSILRAAAEAGIDGLDTAAAYGDSEEVLGRALTETGLAGQFCVITKIPALPDDPPSGGPTAWVRRHLAASREKLRLDCLPVVLLHREADVASCFEELLAAKQRGEVLAVGLSGGNCPAVTREAVDTGRLEALQVPVNLFDRRFREETGTLEAAYSQDLPVFARSALLQGIAAMPVEAIRRKGTFFEPFAELRERLDGLAAGAGLEPVELALRYVLSLRGVSRLLFGVETPEQLQQNVTVASRGPLPEELRAAVDAAVPDLSAELTDPSRWPR